MPFCNLEFFYKVIINILGKECKETEPLYIIPVRYENALGSNYLPDIFQGNVGMGIYKGFSIR
jgi:hypothetical protein